MKCIACPECKHVSYEMEWVLGEVACADCGSHDAIQCRQCKEFIDIVFNETQEVTQ